MGIDPYLAIVDFMACRVFKRTRAGLIRETETSTSVIVEKMVQTHRLTLSDESAGEDSTSARNVASPFLGEPCGADPTKEVVWLMFEGKWEEMRAFMSGLIHSNL